MTRVGYCRPLILVTSVLLYQARTVMISWRFYVIAVIFTARFVPVKANKPSVLYINGCVCIKCYYCIIKQHIIGIVRQCLLNDLLDCKWLCVYVYYFVNMCVGTYVRTRIYMYVYVDKLHPGGLSRTPFQTPKLFKSVIHVELDHVDKWGHVSNANITGSTFICPS